jgi:Golgi phosphoprotein 3
MTSSLQAPLTILEEFLLLALDDEAGQFYNFARSTLDCATVGAVLMDLTLRQRLDNDLKDLFIVDSSPTGDEILDPVLQSMALAPVLTPHPITYWLRQLMDEGEALREKALQRLVARGILKREDKKILWVFGSRRYPMVHDKEIREVKLRILGVILRDDIPAPHDMMLTALAQACGLFRHVLSAHELDAATPRIELVARMDLIGQAVAKAVVEIEGAIAMASGFR